jgi:hypothetical protein
MALIIESVAGATVIEIREGVGPHTIFLAAITYGVSNRIVLDARSSWGMPIHYGTLK